MTPSDQSVAVGTEAADHTPESALNAATGGAASLDKVRDILFGHQMRDVDRRFARLEERMAKDARDLKDEIKRRLDAFEQFVKGETESLSSQVRNEQAERTEGDAKQARELADATRAFERRTTALDEQQSKNQREMRQQLLEQHQRLSDDLRQKVDELLAALAREAQELRHDKTDRQALASLLKEMAMRLTDEFQLPSGEGRGNV
jgi:DNA repair exonuclease SbcCD ATPase subunit